jgi:leader peptidase (prepilin peptidase) / N-methyltransferase
MLFPYLVLAFLLGLSLGSFANVCIYRIPRRESIVTPRSHCPHCQVLISWHGNIPLLSFLILRGKCSHCQGRISGQYPLVELVMGGLSLLTLSQFPIPLSYGLYVVFFVTPLVILAAIDLKHMVLPDIITLPGIAVGILVHGVLSPEPWTQALKESLLGVLVGGGILFIVGTLYEKLRHREGMGGGDVKLMAMIGAFLGWKMAALVIFSSSFLGVVGGLLALLLSRSKRGEEGPAQIPYGPFLALAALLALFYGHQFLNWYLGLTYNIYH